MLPARRRGHVSGTRCARRRHEPSTWASVGASMLAPVTRSTRGSGRWSSAARQQRAHRDGARSLRDEPLVGEQARVTPSTTKASGTRWTGTCPSRGRVRTSARRARGCQAGHRQARPQARLSSCGQPRARRVKAGFAGGFDADHRHAPIGGRSATPASRPPPPVGTTMAPASGMSSRISSATVPAPAITSGWL